MMNLVISQMRAFVQDLKTIGGFVKLSNRRACSRRVGAHLLLFRSFGALFTGPANATLRLPGLAFADQVPSAKHCAPL
jgi:hypothetical protein